jgi:hypothetical protein
MASKNISLVSIKKRNTYRARRNPPNGVLDESRNFETKRFKKGNRRRRLPCTLRKEEAKHSADFSGDKYESTMFM